MHRLALAIAVLALAACDGDDSTAPALAGDALAGDALAGTSEPAAVVDRCAALRGRTIENITIPVGTSCTLREVRVRGNVVALERSRVQVLDATVEGNIDGIGARTLEVRGGRVGGSIQAKDAESPGEAGVVIVGTVLTQGNIQLQDNRTGRIVVTDAVLEKGNIKVEVNRVDEALDVTGNAVAQNLQAFTNTGDGAKRITGNRVGQTLECQANAAPFTGTPNVAGERKEQCAD
jgi:hypothetical protein